MESLEILFINCFFICLAISLILILLRLAKGPSLADRIICVDLFVAVLLTAISVASIYVKEPIYFDASLIIALFGFLGTSIFAKFIQTQEKLR